MACFASKLLSQKPEQTAMRETINFGQLATMAHRRQKNARTQTSQPEISKLGVRREIESTSLLPRSKRLSDPEVLNI